MSTGSDQCQAALELEVELDAAFAAFAVEHSALLRRACLVPDHVDDLSNVVACTMLGHALSRVRRGQGTAATSQLAEAVLSGLDRVDEAQRQRRGTLQ